MQIAVPEEVLPCSPSFESESDARKDKEEEEEDGVWKRGVQSRLVLA